MFADDSEWEAGAHPPHELQSWGKFAGRKGTHSGGLHDHAAKLSVLRERYAMSHSRILNETDISITLEPVDMFQGLGASDIRILVERSLYVCWDSQSGVWVSPRACIADVVAFVTAMTAYVAEVKDQLAGQQENADKQIGYLASAAEDASLPAHIAFPAD